MSARKKTAASTAAFGLAACRLLRERIPADGTVVDPAAIAERATCCCPNQVAEGVVSAPVSGVAPNPTSFLTAAVRGDA